jgi:hypothetical protein
MAKFNIGDKVRFTTRATQHSFNRKRTRTVKRSFYDVAKQCRWYILCDIGKGEGNLYRSYELKLATKLNCRGRPKLRHRGRPKQHE